MAGDRYVVLGLAHARSAWFRQVSQWATESSIPAEFIKCVSAEEVRARLGSGRAHSALLIDSSLSSFDRDLVASASAVLTAVIAVHDGRGPAWSAGDLGVAAVLPADFDRALLLDGLEHHTRMIGRGDQLPPTLDDPGTGHWMGRLAAVCGPGGTGASTVAIALAQGVAADARFARRVCLADFALRADQAMIHDTGELGPGVQELVEAHRLGRPGPDQVRQSTFEVPGRGYRLLLGLRRPESWGVLRPRAVEAAVTGLRRTFHLVIADTSGDIEGEAEGGSIDVEERNALARTVLFQADVAFVVGAPGLKGVHSLARMVRTLIDGGVDPARIVPVVNRAPRSVYARAETGRTFATLVGSDLVAPSPVYVPERKVEAALRDNLRLPEPVVRPLTGAWEAQLRRHGDAPPPSPEPVRVTPGSVGTWSESPR